MNALDYAEKANRIFVLSDSFIRIKELIDCDRSTIDDIAEVIVLDPALASTVLKLANSSFFNYPGKIDTISKAVLILGITEVYNLVIAYFTTEAFQEITADLNYLNDFWEQSVSCALLVKYVGNKMSIKNSERLFILVLLHNIGELVVQQFNPDAVEKCSHHNISNLPWQVQKKELGFTYADVTAELLKLWQLPVSISSPIAGQDDDKDFFALPTETQLLYLAKRIMLQEFVYPNEHITQLIDKDILDTKGIDSAIVQEAHAYSDMEKLAILSVLNPGAATIY